MSERRRLFFKTVAVCVAAVCATVLAHRLDIRLDLTQAGRMTLSQQTLSVLADLSAPVTVYAFIEAGTPDGDRIGRLLSAYRQASSRLRVREVDPDLQPELAKKYSVTHYDTLVVTSGEQSRRISPYEVFGGASSLAAAPFNGEQALTRALLALTRRERVRLYFVRGHGERDLTTEYADIVRRLQDDGFDVQSLELSGAVPDDAAAVVAAGPQQDFTPGEIERLEAYLARGGRFLLMLDPSRTGAAFPDLDAWLGRWSVAPDDDVVIDPERHYFLDVASPLPAYADHAITRLLGEEQLAVVLPQTRSFSRRGAAPAGTSVQPLLISTDSAWGETDFKQNTPRRDPADLKPPLVMAYALTKETAEAASHTGGAGGASSEARLVIMGTSGVADGRVLGFQGNADFILNTLNWLSGRTQMLAIHPQPALREPANIAVGRARGFLWLAAFVWPSLVALTGAAVWLRRRRL
ncbi:MAG TPA: GldG family protein [Limnochordia bacterium]|nr:GldG family protein [Limnochordia bacterium]